MLLNFSNDKHLEYLNNVTGGVSETVVWKIKNEYYISEYLWGFFRTFGLLGFRIGESRVPIMVNVKNRDSPGRAVMHTFYLSGKDIDTINENPREWRLLIYQDVKSDPYFLT